MPERHVPSFVRNASVTLSLAVLFVVVTVATAAERIAPVAVPFSSGPAYPSPDLPDRYAAQRAIDGDPQTFCCLLDDTLAGEDGGTMPPRAAAPVTGHIVFDLGRKTRIAGAALTARLDGGPFNPKQLDFFCYADDDPANNPIADDLEHDSDIRPLLAGQALGPLRAGESATAHWPPVTTRYVGLRVEGSYESGGQHYNFQLGEIEFLVAPLESDVAGRAIAESGPAGHVLREQLDELIRRKCPDDDPAWRQLTATAVAFAPLVRRLDSLRSAVEHLGREYPQQVAAAPLLERLDSLRRRAIDQTGLAEPRFEPLAAEIESLQREALVRRNP
ncbi:MAG: discoidin domain-containing protein, partial [Pirellulaceae bacterium]|nr:discoidin domain-containing protein [Pirellulaceae bacterium]